MNVKAAVLRAVLRTPLWRVGHGWLLVDGRPRRYAQVDGDVVVVGDLPLGAVEVWWRGRRRPAEIAYPGELDPAAVLHANPAVWMDLGVEPSATAQEVEEAAATLPLRHLQLT